MLQRLAGKPGKEANDSNQHARLYTQHLMCRTLNFDLLDLAVGDVTEELWPRGGVDGQL